MRNTRKQSGFTLLEILVYLGLVTLLSVALAVFFWNITSVSERNELSQSTAAEARFVTGRLGSILRNADSLESFAPDRIVLGNSDSSDTTTVSASDGNILIDDGSGASALIGAGVRAADARFEELHASDGRFQYVIFTLTLRPDQEPGVSDGLDIRGSALLRNKTE